MSVCNLRNAGEGGGLEGAFVGVIGTPRQKRLLQTMVH